MSAITQPASKKKKKTKDAGSDPQTDSRSYLLIFGMILAGALLGCSAPGIDQWYLAWFGVVPLFIAIATSSGVKQAFVRGTCFGVAYNMVYHSWALHLQPLGWLGFNQWQGCLLSFGACLYGGLHQGLITGLYAALCRFVPMNGGFLPRKVQSGWGLPAMVILPLLWVLIHNIVLNAHDFLGIPWSMLEYSQYKQHYIIQIASAIGGIGLGYLIVMFNVGVSVFVLALGKKKSAPMLAVSSTGHAFYQLLFAGLIINLLFGLGVYLKDSQANIAPSLTASVVQGNINIEMQKSQHSYTLAEILQHHEALLEKAPPGLAVWAENALPTFLSDQPILKEELSHIARTRNLSMVIGSMDQDNEGHPFNAAFGITADGTILNDVYHKRYLVPYGEYTPWLVKYLPEWLKRLTNTPAGGGFTAGRRPVVLDLRNGRVAPLICFETLSPELVASSVRHGGQLLVNVSDLAWFHDSIIGDQMIAFSVFRAVENRRYFIFAANTGPSAIIGPDGYVKQISDRGSARILTGPVGFSSQKTFFTNWFVF